MNILVETRQHRTQTRKPNGSNCRGITGEVAAMKNLEEDENGVEQEELQKKEKRKGKHDKPKPWDDDPNIDHWKVEKFDPSWNEGGMLEVSSFSTLFPQYLEKHLQEIWPTVKSALKQYGIACELNLVRTSLPHSPSTVLFFHSQTLIVPSIVAGRGLHDGFNHQKDPRPLYYHQSQGSHQASRKKCYSNPGIYLYVCLSLVSLSFFQISVMLMSFPLFPGDKNTWRWSTMWYH